VYEAALLKRLFASVQNGANPDLSAVCRAIVEDEKRLGHSKLATELEATLSKLESTGRVGPKRNPSSRTSKLSSLPSSKRDSAPLVQVLELRS